MSETVFVTKYALTGPIKEYTVDHIDGTMVVVKDPDGRNKTSFFHGKDWHLTSGEALARAIDMRDARVASMVKNIDNLRRRTFEFERVTEAPE